MGQKEGRNDRLFEGPKISKHANLDVFKTSSELYTQDKKVLSKSFINLSDKNPIGYNNFYSSFIHFESNDLTSVQGESMKITCTD